MPAALELAKDSKLRIGSESKNREEARELRLVSSAMSKSPTGIPSFSKELTSLRAPKKSVQEFQNYYNNKQKLMCVNIPSASVSPASLKTERFSKPASSVV